MDINTLLGLNQQLKTIIDENNTDIDTKLYYIKNLSTALKVLPDGYSMILMYNDPNIAGISVLSYPSSRLGELYISLNDTANALVLKDYRHEQIDLTISFHDILAWYIVNGDFIDRLNIAQQFGNIESRTYEDIKRDISTYLMSQNPKLTQLLNIYSPEKYLIDIIAAIYDKVQKYIDYAYSSNDIDKAEGLLLEQLARVEYNYKPTPPYPTKIKAVWTLSDDEYINLLKNLYVKEREQVQANQTPNILFPPLQATIDISIFLNDNMLSVSDATSLFWEGKLGETINLHTNPIDVSVFNDYTYAKNIIEQILNAYIQKGMDYNNNDALSGTMKISDGSNNYILDYTLNVSKGNALLSSVSTTVNLNIPSSVEVNSYTFKPQISILTFNDLLTKSFFNYYILQSLIIHLHCKDIKGVQPFVLEYIINEQNDYFTNVFSFYTLLLRKYQFPNNIELGVIDEEGSYLYAKEFKEYKSTNFSFSKSVIQLDDEMVDPESLVLTVTVNDTPTDSFATTNPLALTNFIWQLKGFEDLTSVTELQSIIQTPIIYIDFNRYGSPILTLLIPRITADTTVLADVGYFTHSGFIPPSELQYKIITFNTSNIDVNVYDENQNLREHLSISYENNYPINFKVMKVERGYDGDTDEQIRQFKDYLPADKFPYALKRAITNKDYQLLLAQYPYISIIKSQLVIQDTFIDESLLEGMRLKSGSFVCGSQPPNPIQKMAVPNNNLQNYGIYSYSLLTGIIYVIKKVTALREVKIYGENNFIKVKETIPTSLNPLEKEQVFDYLLPFMITSNYYKIDSPKIYRIPLQDITFYTENIKNFYNNLSILQERLILLSNIGEPLTYNILQNALSILPYNVEIDSSSLANPLFSPIEVASNEYYYYSFFNSEGKFVAKVYPTTLKEKNKLFVLR